MCCSSSVKHLSQQERSQDALAVQPSPLKMPLAAESYYAAVGCALLTPYKPSFTIEKEPGSAFCVGMSPERPLAPKSYCAAVGIFACALLTPYKPSLTTEKKPGSAFCVAKPPKKPLAAESYRGPLSKFASPPLLEQGASRLLDEALGFGLQSRCFSEYRGSNPPSRGCFLSLRRRSPKVSDCSPANRERELGLDPSFKTSFPYKLVFTCQGLSNLLSPCSSL